MEKIDNIIPGEILLEEFLKPLNISAYRLSKDTGMPATRISQILKGKRRITADTALRLGMYFGIEPEFWLNLQLRYNMKIAKDKLGAKIQQEVKVHLSQANTHNLAGMFVKRTKSCIL